MNSITEQFLEALGQEQILSTVPSGLFLVDNERRVVYWNREAERITGYLATEVIGEHCSFLEGIECGNVCGLFDEGSADKPIIGAECRIRSKSGAEIIISKNVDFIWSRGKIIGGVESFIDISQQKRQEEQLILHRRELEETVKQRTEELREERTRLQSVLDGMSDPAYIVSQDFRLQFLNKSMHELFGESVGKVCYEAIQDRTRPCMNCPWQIIKQGKPVNEERKFGRAKRIYEISHTPLYNSEGAIEKLAVCRDITERKEAAEKLLELNKQLDSFAHTVSHDLRTPLTGVLCYSELIRTQFADALKGEGLELLAEVENQGHRMLNIIDDMLSFSVANAIEMVDTATDANLVAGLVLHDNQFVMGKRQVEAIVKELPEIYAPQGLLYEVISNLVVNALKYGCDDGGTIEIDGEVGKMCDTIIVRDHGPGIPEDERVAVFNVFVRGSTSKNTQGTGIGLATVQRVMDKLEGQIVLEETPGGGCTFKAVFPRREGL